MFSTCQKSREPFNRAEIFSDSYTYYMCMSRKTSLLNQEIKGIRYQNLSYKNSNSSMFHLYKRFDCYNLSSLFLIHTVVAQKDGNLWSSCLPPTSWISESGELFFFSISIVLLSSFAFPRTMTRFPFKNGARTMFLRFGLLRIINTGSVKQEEQWLQMYYYYYYYYYYYVLCGTMKNWYFF